MQVRRDKKIPVALQRNYKEAIISQAYPVFDVTNKDELLPEYLMMWFSRSEFDREACFYAVGGVRGSLEWEDFCNMQLPVPDIEKQKAIVKEYNTIVNRIKLNEHLNQKLEETAQAIYKEWFVDFKFPMTKEYAESIGKPELVGMPYKSDGGEMVWNEELGKEIPVGWVDFALENMCDCNVSNCSNNNFFEEIHYLDTSNLTDNKFEEIKVLKVGIDTIPSRAKRLVNHNDIVYSTVRPNLRHYGIIKYPKENMVVSTGFAVLRVKLEAYYAEFIYQSLIQEETINNFQAKAEMSVSTYPSIKPEDLLEIKIALPKKKTMILDKMNRLLSHTYELIYNNNMEIRKLYKLKDLVLLKMVEGK
jgi:type I restriction enzyme S subunit